MEADAGSAVAALNLPPVAGHATPARRKPLLHGAAIAVAILSLALLTAWLLSPGTAVPPWALDADVALTVFGIVDFVTRSGLQRHGWGYVRSHPFDFFAMFPALLLVGRGIPFQNGWLAILFVARITRSIDRILGDGFVGRALTSLVDILEDDIADRVVLRLTRSAADALGRAHLGQALAEAMADNKAAILAKVREHHPAEGLGAELLRRSGLEDAVARAEDRAYEAIVNVLGSGEVDKALLESLRRAMANVEIRRERQTLLDRIDAKLV
jgi:hypothetical protein